MKESQNIITYSFRYYDYISHLSICIVYTVTSYVLKYIELRSYFSSSTEADNKFLSFNIYFILISVFKHFIYIYVL
jgi:hypothetical protein